MKAQMNTRDRSKLFPATMDDPQRAPASFAEPPSTLPIPLPKKEIKGGVSRKTWDEIERARFGAKAAEPHSTVRGFLFFDMLDISHPLAGAASTSWECGTRKATS